VLSNAIHWTEFTAKVPTCLFTPISSLAEQQVRDLIDEIRQVKRFSISEPHRTTVFSVMTLTQQHYLTRKPESLKAKNCYKGSLLRTRIKHLHGQPIHDLALELCQHFKVTDEFIDEKEYYVFINQIMNPKSLLRRPPAFFL
jgi:hypothetical protein